MVYVVLVILLFIVSVIAHIYICRHRSKRGLHAKVFALTAGIFFGVYVILALVLPSSGMLDPYSAWGMPFRITAGIVFILLVPIYLCFYVLTQLTSPSKKILLTLSQRGELPYSDILSCVQKEDFITSRLNDLCASGCVAQIDGRYILTPEGQKIALILNMMQGILGRNAGG